jgi:hypothetical protein
LAFTAAEYRWISATAPGNNSLADILPRRRTRPGGVEMTSRDTSRSIRGYPISRYFYGRRGADFTPCFLVAVEMMTSVTVYDKLEIFREPEQKTAPSRGKG